MRQQAKKMNVTSLRIGQDSNNMAAEIRVAKVAIFNVTLWLISWTPYLVFVIMGLWGDQTQITPLPAMIQVLLPKTSCAYNPIIYCLSHPKFRVAAKNMYPSLCITVITVKRDSHSSNDNQTTSLASVGSV